MIYMYSKQTKSVPPEVINILKDKEIYNYMYV